MKSVFHKIRTKNPAELVARAHQAFVRLPYESNPERVVDEIAKLLLAMKVTYNVFKDPCHIRVIWTTG